MGEVKINLDTTPSETPVKKPTVEEARKVQASDKPDTSKKKQNDEKEYISSLFNHNPDIPTISQTEFEPAKEDIFSAKTFDQLNLDSHLVKNLSDLGLTSLTTIQSKALPVIMGGKDALIKSQSGSGKFRTDNRPVVEFLPGRVRGLADHECSRKQQMDFSVQTFHF